MTDTTNNIPHKYEIVLVTGRILFANSYRKQDNIIRLSNNNGNLDINLDNVKEIKEIKQPQIDTSKDKNALPTNNLSVPINVKTENEDLENDKNIIQKMYEESKLKQDFSR
jgi:hypothetical protein